MTTNGTLPNTKIDDEIRDLAFGFWVDSCRRSPARVSAKMAELGHDLSASLIGKWADRHNWEARADEELNVFAPGIRRMTAFRLIGNADLASRIEQQYLQAYMDSGEPPDKTIVAAVKEALAHGGFSPIGARDPVAPSGSNGGDSPSALMDRYFPTGIPARSNGDSGD